MALGDPCFSGMVSVLRGYYVSFLSMVSMLALLQAVLDARFSIYAAKGESRPLPEHFGLYLGMGIKGEEFQ